MPKLNKHSVTELIHEPISVIIRRVGEVAAKCGIETYAVGGIVRDILLDRKTTDIDFVTIGQGTGIMLAEAVCEDFVGATAHEYANFGTASVHIPSPETAGVAALEFVGARKESYRRDSRKPIVEEGTLEDDLRRRDFTINAMAMHISPDRFADLIDPFDGCEDIKRQVLHLALVVWGQLHGLVSLEIFDQLQPVGSDSGALYRFEVTAIIKRLLIE